MNDLLRISEASRIGLHAMVYIATHNAKPVTTKEIASTFKVSEAHLSKVLQRLVRASLIQSTRGPLGGFKLIKDPSQITLLDIIEIIDGRLVPSICLLGQPVCNPETCVLKDFTYDIHKKIIETMNNITLENFAEHFSLAKP